MKRTLLNQNWTVKPLGKLLPYPRNQAHTLLPVPATVPGSVHLDLHAAGFIGHPFYERNEAGLKWIDESDWCYGCEFNWKPDIQNPNRVLRFHGLDTVATVFLNGERLADNDNFFLPLEVNVSERLLDGVNKLEIHFLSAVNVGDARRSEYFTENDIDPQVSHFDERAFVRKPGYMSGWDWGPRLVSCGIWRPVELVEFQSRIEFFSVHQKSLGDGSFELTAEVRISGNEAPTLSYNGKTLPVGETVWTVKDALWWPVGEGSQPLQTVTLSLPSGDSVTKKIGLRTIDLIREPDAIGTSFEFVVNGRKIWSRGANWIPHDSFPGIVKDSDYHEAIDRYARLGMNMLRVWGGGLYETEAFYDACDQAGILVWQDFPYACCYYPDDAAHQEVAAKEAVYHVERLRDRTSLALWCGNNENRAMWFGKWGGAEKNPKRFYAEPIYDEVLRSVVSKHDPSRSYIESSPVLVNGMPGYESNAPEHSDDHFWDVWHGRGDWCFYKDSKTRFSSEFGFASSCSMAVWRDVSKRELTHEDPAVRWHDKTGKPWEVFHGMVAKHYPSPENLEDWIYYSQLNQRDAMRAALEHYRGGDRCRGALIWQINDCWPVQSWALEDYRRLLKPAGFEMTRLYSGILICADVVEGVLKVTIANDRELPVSGQLTLDAIDTLSGAVVGSLTQSVQVSAQGRALVAEWSVSDRHATSTAIRCRLEGVEVGDRWVLLAEPKETLSQPVELTANLVEGTLIVQGKGAVLDLVVWNEEEPSVLADPQTGLSGFAAVSQVDPEIRLRVTGQIGTLRARSLAGLHAVRYERELAKATSNA